METLTIWCRTAELAPDKHLATVCAIPADGPDVPGAVRSESRVFSTPELAESECHRMAQAMKDRLTAQGYKVVRVDSV